jgi:hypothetical protein
MVNVELFPFQRGSQARAPTTHHQKFEDGRLHRCAGRAHNLHITTGANKHRLKNSGIFVGIFKNQKQNMKKCMGVGVETSGLERFRGKTFGRGQLFNASTSWRTDRGEIVIISQIGQFSGRIKRFNTIFLLL